MVKLLKLQNKQRHLRFFLLALVVIVCASVAVAAIVAFSPSEQAFLDPDDNMPGYPDNVAATPAALTSARGCTPTLWAHVHQPSRLKIFDNCKQISGTIISIQFMGDGDEHIDLRPDARYFSQMNVKNILFTNDAMVVEAICAQAPIEDSSEAACANFHNTIHVPPVGTHVTVTGSYVMDLPHGWNEIHPLSAITVTR